MKNMEWFNHLTASKELKYILPIQVQPNLPYPVWRKDQLVFYVPFYHLWPQGESLLISPALCGTVFSANTKALISYQNYMLEDPSLTGKSIGRKQPEQGELSQLSLAMTYQFSLLDEMEKMYLRNSQIPKALIKEYTELLPSAQWMPELLEMYNFCERSLIE